MLTLVSIFFGLIFFILGTFVGSFLNVLIDRLPRNETLLGRSYCENCKKTLKWIDLIPLLSFLVLKGRCRYCRIKLSYQYLLLEIVTGLFFMFIYLASYPDILLTSYNLLIVSSLIVIFFVDLKFGIIPDKVLIFLVILGLIFNIFINPNLLVINLFTGLGTFLFFLLIFLLTKGKGMGFGDVKFAFVLGLILGFPGIVLSLYVAFLTGGIVGIILILWKKKSMKFAVPFGPFLVFGAIVVLFFSEILIPKITTLLALQNWVLR